jgi:hypothetical protein
MTDRFSPKLRKLLQKNQYQLEGFSDRIKNLLSIEQELARARRNKLFIIYHDLTSNMFLGEADMVVVDLASWAYGFYKKRGLLRSLQGKDLDALRLDCEYEPGGVINLDGKEHPEIDRHLENLMRAHRQDAFNRLFPGGTTGPKPNTPSPADIDELCTRLHAQFKALRDDRNQHRAHRYENGKVTGAALSLADVTKYLEACQALLSDIRYLSSNSHFAATLPVPPEDDEYAQDVVDLILLGDMRTIIDAEYGPKNAKGTSHGFYHQRRKAHYDRLHELDDLRGDPMLPFNDRSLIPEDGE